MRHRLRPIGGLGADSLFILDHVVHSLLKSLQFIEGNE